MALSRDRRRGHIDEDMYVWSSTSWIFIADPLTTLELAAHRMMAPFHEIASDMVDATCTVASGAANLAQSVQGHSDILAVRSKHSKCDGSLNRIALVAVAVAESAGPAAILLFTSPHLGPVMICGAVIPFKTMYLCSAALFAAGSLMVWGKNDAVIDRQCHHRGAVALGVTCLFYTATGLLGPLPDSIAELVSSWGIAFPEVALRHIQDFVVSPLLLINLGYLVGAGPREMLPAISYEFLATSCSIAGACYPEHLGQYILTGVACLSHFAAAAFVSELPTRRPQIATSNKIRCRTAGDLMISGWVAVPLLQLAGIYGAIPLTSLLPALMFFDIVFKFGVCHVSLRCPRVLLEADLQTNLEPHGEPPPAAPTFNHMGW